MKHLKQFKIFENKQSDEEIHALCNEYGIENYTINLDKAIDVDGSVFIYKKGLTELPLKFRNVSGYFTCSNNNLTTLEGAPETVGGYFDCSNNNLKTLEGSPETVGGYFGCSNNNLRTLEGAPERVGGNFGCSNNKNLMSFKGIPDEIGENLNCSNTPIYYFWKLMGKNKDLIGEFNFWDPIDGNKVSVPYLINFLEENYINRNKIDLEHIKYLGYELVDEHMLEM